MLPSSTKGVYFCYLHSEDAKLHGPKALTAKSFAKYFEKARCLNSMARRKHVCIPTSCKNFFSVTVSCTEMYMTVKYVPEIEFFGKMYMQGYSENLECYTRGSGRKAIVLKVPVFRNQCGIMQAKSANNR